MFHARLRLYLVAMTGMLESQATSPLDAMGCGPAKPTILAHVQPVWDGSTPWHPITRALCVGGGGARAFSYSLGVLRGLQRLKLMNFATR